MSGTVTSAQAARATPVDANGFRTAMGSFATGVTVVTVAAPDGELHGMTVNSFSSVSLDPTLVLVCLTSTSHGLRLIESSGAFGINVLSAGQEGVSRWFASRQRPADSRMFRGVAFELGATGCPVLLGAAASFDCLLHQLYRAGDHHIVVGEVVGLVHRPELEPLVFHAGAYRPLEQQPAPAPSVRLRVVRDGRR